MHSTVGERLKYALETDDSKVFRPAFDKREAQARYVRERLPENNPRVMTRFAAAILPVAWALHELIEGGRHEATVSTKARYRTCLIAVRVDEIPDHGESAAARIFSPTRAGLKLTALTLRFGRGSTQVGLVLPYWHTGCKTRAKKRTYLTFDTQGNVRGDLGYPGSIEILSREVCLLGKFLRGLTDSRV